MLRNMIWQRILNLNKKTRYQLLSYTCGLVFLAFWIATGVASDPIILAVVTVYVQLLMILTAMKNI
tara:strand:+ start:262 stop:459 length:198 start_codon:yes stop_codon:yes gene_type:complete